MDRGTPARSKFLTALLRRSWTRRPTSPADSQALFHARRMSRTCCPWRWKTHGISFDCELASFVVRLCCSTSRLLSGGRTSKGNVRPSSFLVLPGSRRTTPASKSTWLHRSSVASDRLHPAVSFFAVPITLPGLIRSAWFLLEGSGASETDLDSEALEVPIRLCGEVVVLSSKCGLQNGDPSRRAVLEDISDALKLVFLAASHTCLRKEKVFLYP